MIKQSQTQAKQAPIATIGTVDQANPVLSGCNKTEVNDPQIGQTSRNHQCAQTFRFRQMTFMEVKSAALLVGKEGFDLEAFFVPITGFATQFKVGHQKD